MLAVTWDLKHACDDKHVLYCNLIKKKERKIYKKTLQVKNQLRDHSLWDKYLWH